MDNKQISHIFEEIADMLDISGEEFFRVNAYRKAAFGISNLPFSLKTIVQNSPHELDKMPGIGEHLKKKIIELVNTGKCEEHEQLKKKIPAGILEMLHLRGIGPKKIQLFYHRLKITNIGGLKKAAEEHKIREIEGMGEKSEQEILKSIEEYSTFQPKRILISYADSEAEKIIDYMKECKAVKKIQYAGSLRRGHETIGDIDILVAAKSSDSKIIMDHFVKYSEAIKTIVEGETKSTVLLNIGVDVDLRIVDEDIFGAALHYFTGNKDHNIKIRELAKKKGLKVSEYGVFKDEKLLCGKTEEEVFASVGLPYIIPELRRDEGEIEFGLSHKFPKFIELSDIKGDLHCHSTYSDGQNSLEKVAEAYIKMGYEYFAITDHSSVMGVTGGMGKKEIEKQWKEIDNLNKKLKGKIKIFRGCEVDILKDGSLDFGDEILKQLEVVIISAHLYHNLPYEDQTKRLIAAIENPYSKILGHPTGRLINKRAPMEFDMEKIISACAQNNVAIEINSNPQRLDLIDKYIKIAKEKKVKITISTDSHNFPQMEYMKYGVLTARRGWLEKKDILNTKSLKEFDSVF